MCRISSAKLKSIMLAEKTEVEVIALYSEIGFDLDGTFVEVVQKLATRSEDLNDAETELLGLATTKTICWLRGYYHGTRDVLQILQKICTRWEIPTTMVPQLQGFAARRVRKRPPEIFYD